MKENEEKKQWSKPSIQQFADPALNKTQLDELLLKQIINSRGFVLDVDRYNRHIKIWQKTK